jgi:hypothetical protein
MRDLAEQILATRSEAYGNPDRVGSQRASLAADHRGRVWEPSQGSHVDDVLYYAKEAR